MPKYESLFPGALDTFILHGNRDGIGLDIDFQESDELSSDELNLITDAILQLETWALALTTDAIWDADGDTGITTEAAADEDILRFNTFGTERMVILANGKIGIATAVVPHGGEGYALLALEGLQANANGPHVQFTTAEDDYPTLQILNWEHDELAIYFDAYRDAGGELSSDVGSNFRIGKGLTADTFSIEYDSGIAQGGVITWNDGITLDTAGNVTMPGGTLIVGGRGIIEGDAIGGRVWRKIFLQIQDGTNANTLKCTIGALWNGDAVGTTDNCAKGATTGNFTINAGGNTLDIEAAAFSGDVIMAIGTIYNNATSAYYDAYVDVSGVKMRIFIYDNAGNIVDITGAAVVDAGDIVLHILYQTDA